MIYAEETPIAPIGFTKTGAKVFWFSFFKKELLAFYLLSIVRPAYIPVRPNSASIRIS
jgi:hypothetical protein